MCVWGRPGWNKRGSGQSCRRQVVSRLGAEGLPLLDLSHPPLPCLQLREKLLNQHDINDDTAEETFKILQDMGRVQQESARLARELATKVGV